MSAKDREIILSVDGQDVAVPRGRTRSTRNAGKKSAKAREFNDKFANERVVDNLSPLNKAQDNYMKSLSNNIISIASGHAGCGKTYCPSYLAAQKLLAKKIDKIILTRPYAHLGKDYGATPGTDFEKLEPFCRPMLDTIKSVVGPEKYEYYVSHKIIEIAPLEKIQGRSMDERCCIIADEIQNATKPQVLSLVTRLGEEVDFLAICGDPRQSVTRGENALDWITAFFKRNSINDVGITLFTEEDCVRSGIVKDILIAFEKEGGFYSTLDNN